MFKVKRLIIELLVMYDYCLISILILQACHRCKATGYLICSSCGGRGNVRILFTPVQDMKLITYCRYIVYRTITMVLETMQTCTRSIDYIYKAHRRGRRDCNIVRFTTSAISAYHHYSCEFLSRSWQGVLDTALSDKVCQCLATCRWFSPGTPVSSISKTDRHEIAEMLLKVALNTINKQANKQI